MELQSILSPPDVTVFFNMIHWHFQFSRQKNMTKCSVHSGVFFLLIPAVYTSEENSLAFICRPHLPCVVHHTLFIAPRAASVNHRSLQFRVRLFLPRQCGLLHRVKDHSGADLPARELCYRNTKGAAATADSVLYPRDREDIPTLRAKVRVTPKTRHSRSMRLGK